MNPLSAPIFITIGDRILFLPQLLCQLFKLLTACLIQCRMDCYRCICKSKSAALLKHAFHNFCCKRCPGTILDNTYHAVLEVAFCQVINEITHMRENTCIVSCCCKNKLAVTEGVTDRLKHITAGKVHSMNLFPFGFKPFFQFFNRFLGIAVNGGISY